MKGIILAGGTGSRLLPLTNIVNKFLLPIYNKPLIEYSIDTLKTAGIKDVAIVVGKKSAGQTIEYLQSGQRYDAKFTYFFQDEPLGLPNALSYVEDFTNNEPFVVLCADNIIIDNINPFIEKYIDGCFITCKKIHDENTLKKLAILYVNENNKVTHLEEKPTQPKSNLAFAGIQIYDSIIWDIIKKLKPSARGEFEITHVINEYIKMKKFNFGFLEQEWIDAGTPETLFEAQQIIYKKFHTQ